MFRFLKIIVLAAFLLTSCSRVTQENFDKIQVNMTLSEVRAILGEPTETESVNIFGISGTSAVWKNHDSEIVIQFLDNKVTLKTFNKNSEQKSPEKDKESD